MATNQSIALPRKKKGDRYVTRVQGRQRYVTRELACIEFLQNIPLTHEDLIISIAKSKYSSGLLNSNEDSYSDNSLGDESTIPPTLDWISWFMSFIFCFCIFSHHNGSLNGSVNGSGLGVEMRRRHSSGEESEDEQNGDLKQSDIWERTTETGHRSKRSRRKKQVAQPLESPLLNREGSSEPVNPSSSSTSLLNHIIPSTLSASSLSSLSGQASSPTSIAAASLEQRRGRKLVGPTSPDITMPLNIRYRSRVDASASLKQWEKVVFHQPQMESSRLFSSCSNGYPIMVSSVIRFDPSEEENRRRRQKLLDLKAISVFKTPKRDWRGISYGSLFPEGKARLKKGVHDDDINHAESIINEVEEIGEYVPGLIDDPEMGQGKYSQVIRGDDILGPFICSILKFATSSDLKDELNNQWRERHPEQPASLTLSKIRNLKAETLAGCVKCDLEVCTVAYACIYFERLVMQRIVTKANRRLTMATCLVLAYKFNEPIYISEDKKELQLAFQQQQPNHQHSATTSFSSSSSLHQSTLPQVRKRDPKMKLLYDFIDEEWSITPEQVQESEFGVLVKLQFQLHAKASHISLHFHRLLTWAFINLSPREYLGDEDVYQSWARAHIWKADHEPPPVVEGIHASDLSKKRDSKASSSSSSSSSSSTASTSSSTSTAQQWWRRTRSMTNITTTTPKSSTSSSSKKNQFSNSSSKKDKMMEEEEEEEEEDEESEEESEEEDVLSMVGSPEVRLDDQGADEWRDDM